MGMRHGEINNDEILNENVTHTATHTLGRAGGWGSDEVI